MVKRRVNVRKHKRKLKTGNQTIVRKHARTLNSSRKPKTFIPLTKEQKERILKYYKEGKYSPSEIWIYRDIRQSKRTPKQKYIIQLDNKEILNARKTRVADLSIKDRKQQRKEGIERREDNPKDPFSDIRTCKPIRKDGDPREDIFCLTETERKKLDRDYFGLNSERYPELIFLDPYKIALMPPNQSLIYYTSLSNTGIPKINAKKYLAS